MRAFTLSVLRELTLQRHDYPIKHLAIGTTEGDPGGTPYWTMVGLLAELLYNTPSATKQLTPVDVLMAEISTLPPGLKMVASLSDSLVTLSAALAPAPSAIRLSILGPPDEIPRLGALLAVGSLHDSEGGEELMHRLTLEMPAARYIADAARSPSSTLSDEGIQVLRLTCPDRPPKLDVAFDRDSGTRPTRVTRLSHGLMLVLMNLTVLRPHIGFKTLELDASVGAFVHRPKCSGRERREWALLLRLAAEWEERLGFTVVGPPGVDLSGLIDKEIDEIGIDGALANWYAQTGFLEGIDLPDEP